MKLLIATIVLFTFELGMGLYIPTKPYMWIPMVLMVFTTSMLGALYGNVPIVGLWAAKIEHGKNLQNIVVARRCVVDKQYTIGRQTAHVLHVHKFKSPMDNITYYEVWFRLVGPVEIKPLIS